MGEHAGLPETIGQRPAPQLLELAERAHAEAPERRDQRFRLLPEAQQGDRLGGEIAPRPSLVDEAPPGASGPGAPPPARRSASARLRAGPDGRGPSVRRRSPPPRRRTARAGHPPGNRQGRPARAPPPRPCPRAPRAPAPTHGPPSADRGRAARAPDSAPAPLPTPCHARRRTPRRRRRPPPHAARRPPPEPPPAHAPHAPGAPHAARDRPAFGPRRLSPARTGEDERTRPYEHMFAYDRREVNPSSAAPPPIR